MQVWQLKSDPSKTDAQVFEILADSRLPRTVARGSQHFTVLPEESNHWTIRLPELLVKQVRAHLKQSPIDKDAKGEAGSAAASDK